MSETPLRCSTCRHWTEYLVRVRVGAIGRQWQCEYKIHPNKDGSCMSVWPRAYVEEVPTTETARGEGE